MGGQRPWLPGRALTGSHSDAAEEGVGKRAGRSRRRRYAQARGLSHSPTGAPHADLAICLSSRGRTVCNHNSPSPWVPSPGRRCLCRQAGRTVRTAATDPPLHCIGRFKLQISESGRSFLKMIRARVETRTSGFRHDGTHNPGRRCVLGLRGQ